MGAVTAAALASIGHRTTVIDVDPVKVRMLNSGRSPIFEPGLDELLGRLAGRTLFASDGYEAVAEADVVFICVGTPSRPDGTADLGYVKRKKTWNRLVSEPCTSTVWARGQSGNT